MTTRLAATIERMTLKRQVPMVPCTYAADTSERWAGVLASCGSLIPYGPKHPCPRCGQRQVNAHAPEPPPDALIIDRDVAIVDPDTGKVVAVYVVCAADIATSLAADLRDVEFSSTPFMRNTSTVTRLSGIAAANRTFGYQPPVPLRRRYGCSRSQFNAQHPEAAEHLAEFCRVAERAMRAYAEDVYDITAVQVRRTIPTAWLIAGTPWSSGIINKTLTLPYHTDKANIPLSWSAMLGARRNMDGGLLHLADYNAWFTIAHGSIIIFDGQSVVHGVSPMHPVGANPWRYTAVVYAKSAMKVCCGDPKDEAQRAARAATDAETRRIGNRVTGKRR